MPATSGRDACGHEPPGVAHTVAAGVLETQLLSDGRVMIHHCAVGAGDRGGDAVPGLVNWSNQVKVLPGAAVPATSWEAPCNPRSRSRVKRTVPEYVAGFG